MVCYLQPTAVVIAANTHATSATFRFLEMLGPVVSCNIAKHVILADPPNGPMILRNSHMWSTSRTDTEEKAGHAHAAIHLHVDIGILSAL